VVLGYASWKWQHLATVLAGGGVGALLIGAGFAWLDASERVVILTQIVVFITFVALGSVLVNKTLIILTSVEGAFLFAAGMIILLHVRTSPLYYFSNFVDQTGWFTGFTIFSATVIGICVQLAGASAEKHHGKM
jgi:hypothetical protein